MDGPKGALWCGPHQAKRRGASAFSITRHISEKSSGIAFGGSARARTQVSAGACDAYLEAVRDLPKTLSNRDVDRSRAHLRDLLGPIEVEATEAEIRFKTKKGALEGTLSRWPEDRRFLWWRGQELTSVYYSCQAPRNSYKSPDQ